MTLPARPVCLRNELVSHKRDPSAIGRETGHVDGSLAAEEAAEHVDLFGGERHPSQRHVFILRMTFHVFFERNENERFTIRRRMREPVVEFVVGELRLLVPVGDHSPEVHAAGAIRVEIDVLPIRRILGAIVEALGGGEPAFRGRRRRG